MAETNTDFIPYEYRTVQVNRDLEPLYKDTYRNFGWILEGYGTGLPNASTTTLKLKRDRRINNRQAVLDQEHAAERSLATIASLEQSKQTAPTIVAITAGIIGSAFLAGSIFALNATLWALSIVLGAVGLIGWLVGYVAYTQVKARRTAKVTPLIDHEYDTIYAAGERASELMNV